MFIHTFCTGNRSFLYSSCRLHTSFLLWFCLHLFIFACLSLIFLPFVSGISKSLRLFFLSRGYAFQYLGIFFCLKYPNKFSTPQMLQYFTKFCQLFREKSCVLNSSTSFLRQGIKFCYNDGSLVIISLLLSSYSSICEWRSVFFIKNVLINCQVKKLILLLQK